MARDRSLAVVAPLSALLAGALPALTFPEPSLSWLAPVVLVAWMVLLARAGTPREAALRGWLGGVGFVLAVHHWLVPNTHVFTPIVAAALGLLWLPWGVLVRHLLRPPSTGRRVLAAVLLVPSAWLLVEVARSWESLGGPWGLLGSSQSQVPPALALAALGGVWLVSWVLVAVNVAVTAVVLSPRRGIVAAGVATVAVLAAGTFAYAGVWASISRAGGGPVLRVAAVQPGVVDGPGARLDLGEQLTGRIRPGSADLVVWGESSVGFDLASRPGLRTRLSRLSEQVGAPLLLNVDARRGHGGIAKSTVLVGDDGVLGEYDKTRLVPFGEYVPVRGVLGWLTGASRAADEDRRRGPDVTVLRQGPGDIGPLVCFESAFPDMTRTLARRGAGLVVVQASTSTFQGSWAPEQHAALAALRAAESGRPVVHATLTGQTRAFDAAGRELGQPMDTDRRGVASYRVPLAVQDTPFVRWGAWVPFTAVALVAGWAVAAACRRAVGVRRRAAALGPPGSALDEDVGGSQLGSREIVDHEHGTGFGAADRHREEGLDVDSGVGQRPGEGGAGARAVRQPDEQ